MSCLLCKEPVKCRTMPLCEEHAIYLKLLGIKKFAWKYPKVKEWATRNNKFDILNAIYDKGSKFGDKK